jgi:hypothetical protein
VLESVGAGNHRDACFERIFDGDSKRPDISRAVLTRIGRNALFSHLGHRLRLISVQSKLRPDLGHFEKGLPVFFVRGLIRPTQALLSVKLIVA